MSAPLSAPRNKCAARRSAGPLRHCGGAVKHGSVRTASAATTIATRGEALGGLERGFGSGIHEQAGGGDTHGLATIAIVSPSAFAAPVTPRSGRRGLARRGHFSCARHWQGGGGIRLSGRQRKGCCGQCGPRSGGRGRSPPANVVKVVREFFARAFKAGAIAEIDLGPPVSPGRTESRRL